MKVLFFGTSGNGKGKIIQQLEVLDENVVATELEAEWANKNGTTWRAMLDAPTAERIKALEEALQDFRLKISQRQKLYAIGLHATNTEEAFLSSPVPVGALRNIRPNYCITVFDDLYVMRKRLADAGFHFNYQQLLRWRSAELVVSDLIASVVVKRKQGLPDPPNFWLGSKHPKLTLRRLLFEPSRPRVYSAFSITAVVALRERDPRKSQQLIEEITKYRKELYQRNLTVFDPATLDDRCLINWLSRDKVESESFDLGKEERWPYVISTEKDYLPLVDDPPDTFPIVIKRTEAHMLRESSGLSQRPYGEIDNDITQVDLRYVAQAEFVTVWRPFMEGVASAGCLREATEASAQRKEVIAYCPESDEIKWKEKNPNSKPLTFYWPSTLPLMRNEEKFWSAVDRVANKIQRRKINSH